MCVKDRFARQRTEPWRLPYLISIYRRNNLRTVIRALSLESAGVKTLPRCATNRPAVYPTIFLAVSVNVFLCFVPYCNHSSESICSFCRLLKVENEKQIRYLGNCMYSGRYTNNALPQ